MSKDKKIEVEHDWEVEEAMETLKRYAKLVEDKKLKEEADEYLADNSIEELADLQEVIYAILDERNISKEDFENIRLEKVERRGAFKDRVFLETLDID